MRNSVPLIFLTFLLLVAAVFRFSFLDWGNPFFFHPDENNITSAIAGLSLTQWNPHFFAYGSLPIYFTYLLLFFIHEGKQLPFPLIAYALRFISATLSFLIIPSLFYIGKKVFSYQVGLTAALLSAFGIGFIQFAHFGTFEMWLTFFSLWFFYATVLFWKKATQKHLLFLSVIGGILLAIKISSLVLLPLPLILFFFQKNQNTKKLFSSVLIYLTIVCFIFIATNPYVLLTPSAVIDSLNYESSVALGSTHVFYTQSFLHTIPILFQLRYIFPFLLNPFILLTFLFSLLALFFQVTKEKDIRKILLLTFFLIIFFSQAFFFVKWTRYMVPALPFIYLIISVWLSTIQKRVATILWSTLLAVSVFYAILFVSIVYQRDSRIEASVFLQNHLSNRSALIEPYDLGIVAFSHTFPQQTVIDLYDIDTNPSDRTQLELGLQTNQIFLSLSQRLMKTRLLNPQDFPIGNNLYKHILFDKTKYRVVYQTSCTLWCQILYSGNPLYSVEETATVFDHPFVTIFQKI